MIRRHSQKLTVDLKRLFELHQDDAPLLQELLEELAFRKKADSRSLMARVLARLQEIEQQLRYRREFTELKNGGISNSPADAPSAPEQTGDSTAPSSPLPRHDLFGIDTISYGPLPDDRDRPKRLSGIRPLGTKGLPDAYVRPLKKQISLDVPTNADIPDRFIVALNALVGEMKRTGAGQKRYELENGRRAELPATSSTSFPSPMKQRSLRTLRLMCK